MKAASDGVGRRRPRLLAGLVTRLARGVRGNLPPGIRPLPTACKGGGWGRQASDCFRRRTLSGAGICEGNCLAAQGCAGLHPPRQREAPTKDGRSGAEDRIDAEWCESTPRHFRRRVQRPRLRHACSANKQGMTCVFRLPPGRCLALDTSRVTKGHQKATGRPLPPPPIPLPNTTPPRTTTGAVLLLR
jgi:hypothetical protein